MMADRDIRAYLRGAVVNGIIHGWYVTGFAGNKIYIVSPYPRPTVTYAQNTASEYCYMLKAAGIEPSYRESEPHNLG